MIKGCRQAAVLFTYDWSKPASESSLFPVFQLMYL